MLGPIVMDDPVQGNRTCRITPTSTTSRRTAAAPTRRQSSSRCTSRSSSTCLKRNDAHGGRPGDPTSGSRCLIACALIFFSVATEVEMGGQVPACRDRRNAPGLSGTDPRLAAIDPQWQTCVQPRPRLPTPRRPEWCTPVSDEEVERCRRGAHEHRAHVRGWTRPREGVTVVARVRSRRRRSRSLPIADARDTSTR